MHYSYYGRHSYETDTDFQQIRHRNNDIDTNPKIRHNGTIMIKEGDIITLGGQYQKRTFWQWITRQPKQPTQFRAGLPAEPYGMTPLIPIDAPQRR